MNDKIVSLIAILFLTLLTGGGYSQSSPNFSELIIGSWSGKGQLFGQEAMFSMKWEDALESKFVRLIFSNKFKDQSGVERIMNAEAFYDMKEGKGYWFDSRGIMLPLKLEFDENSMTVFWGDEHTERGKTVYTHLEDDQVGVKDFVFKDGKYLPFGSAEYRRNNSDGK